MHIVYVLTCKENALILYGLKRILHFSGCFIVRNHLIYLLKRFWHLDHACIWFVVEVRTPPHAHTHTQRIDGSRFATSSNPIWCVLHTALIFLKFVCVVNQRYFLWNFSFIILLVCAQIGSDKKISACHDSNPVYHRCGLWCSCASPH